MAEHCNTLDGKTWLKHSISIWSDLAKSREEKALNHPGSFPQALAERLITLYSFGPGATILDPFSGIGSTLLAARSLGRHAIGIELSPTYVEQTNTRLMQQSLFSLSTLSLGDIPQGEPTVTVYQNDARHVADLVQEESVDLVVTSPPYWDILNRKRTQDHKQVQNYSGSTDDLGNIADYPLFLDELASVFSGIYRVVKNRGYVVVNVMDLRKGQMFYPLHMDVALMMQKIGFQFADTIIWDRRQEYNHVGPIGYPVVFLINKVHEYLLIFRKPKGD